MEIDHHVDARIAGAAHRRLDAIEIGLVVGAARRLDAAPVDRQPQEVEAELAHAAAIGGLERRDGLERNATVGERHVEHTLDTCVDTAQDGDPSLLVAKMSPVGGERCGPAWRALSTRDDDQYQRARTEVVHRRASYIHRLGP